MEVLAPTTTENFNRNRNSPSNYISAPASPTRLTEFYREFEQLLITADNHHRSGSPATVPFAWEEKPGVPKPFNSNIFQQDFAFDLSGHFPTHLVSADDLFHGGVIRPLLEKKRESEATTTREPKRRERRSSSSASDLGLPSSRSRRTRSLPPVIRSSTQNTKPPLMASAISSKGSKKWSFKDLFLFRSASDGRAMDRDPLKKYSAIFRKHDEDVRNSSLRSRSKRKGGVSAHEMHYTVNRAVSNDMKKKSFLPYKQGILGRLAFNPTVHALANGFGFSNKTRQLN